MEILKTNNIPVKAWADLYKIESGALDQIRNVASLPFAVDVALMPDAHAGYGCPIGTVAAMKDVVVPNIVGVDIGCGMVAKRTELMVNQFSTTALKEIMGIVRENVPVGFNWHKEPKPERYMPQTKVFGPVSLNNYDRARSQLGTLGGGNHFIEIQAGDDGYVWIMIHSGSRNLGKTVAEHYNLLARKLTGDAVPPNWDLAYLPLDSEEGALYMEEMKYCVEFAYSNRGLMLAEVVNAFASVLGDGVVNDMHHYNIAHNYAAPEAANGHLCIVHRKGATSARYGEVGIIPGSQGSKSYIVRGFGNEEAMESCSHGAGRVMSRSKARKTLNLEEEIAKLDEQGIVHSIRNQKDLDEASSAYKDIDEVMANQTDLVEVMVTLRPLGVIKG